MTFPRCMDRRPTSSIQLGSISMVQQTLQEVPSLIFGMLRRTIMPKVGNNDVVRFPYYEAIRAIQSGDKLNVVEWMAARMIECKLDRRGALVF